MKWKTKDETVVEVLKKAMLFILGVPEDFVFRRPWIPVTRASQLWLTGFAESEK